MGCAGKEGPAKGVAARVEDDTVILSNANTTIGYAHFSKADASIEYIFVHPAFRRQGYGRRLIDLCEHASNARLTPAPPISPLGRYLFG